MQKFLIYFLYFNLLLKTFLKKQLKTTKICFQKHPFRNKFFLLKVSRKKKKIVFKRGYQVGAL